MFPDDLERASETLTEWKFANGGQINGIVVAYHLANRFCFRSEGKRNGLGQSIAPSQPVEDKN
jgi:hypothetical protein